MVVTEEVEELDRSDLSVSVCLYGFRSDFDQRLCFYWSGGCGGLSWGGGDGGLSGANGGCDGMTTTGGDGFTRGEGGGVDNGG